VNTSPPTITGTAQDGQTLNASPGGWNGTQPITYAYEWQRCDSSGANCSAIPGTTTSTYTVTSADVGKTLRVAVTATNSAGSATATSNATAVVQAASGQPGLVALWHMNETSGTVMNDSIAGHNGTLHSVQLAVPGFSGTGYGFNGSSSYVSVPSAGDLNPGSANLTITINLKATSVPATPDWDLIRKGLYTTPGGEYKMEYQPSGQASCGFNGSAGYSELTAGPAINNGQWHTVQCVKTSTAIKVVVDGQAFSKSATIGTIANTDASPIGARPGSEYFKGSLDEASIQIG
jgi:concanavalin A-like lectin/glucanase superfamily protein